MDQSLLAFQGQLEGEIRSLTSQNSSIELSSLFLKYQALISEAKSRDSGLHEKFEADYEALIVETTPLRIGLKVDILQQAQGILYLDNLLGTKNIKNPSTGQKRVTEQANQRLSYQAKKEHNKPKTKISYDQNEGQYVSEINRRKLMGTYVRSSVICEIGGYSNPTFYNRVSGKDVPTQGRGEYLLDDTTIPIFFGKKGGSSAAKQRPTNPSRLKNDSKKIISWDEMIGYAQTHFGEKAESQVAVWLSEHGSSLQVGSNQFSKVILDELISEL